MKEAIQKAIEGGYHHHFGIDSDVLLDPLFWSSLGKAMGEEDDYEEYGDIAMDKWKWNMHRFIDHRAEGKDAESFFTNLLNP